MRLAGKTLMQIGIIGYVILWGGWVMAQEDDGFNSIELPKPRLRSQISVEEALKNRRSVREFREQPLTLNEVGQLLWAAYGVTRPEESGGRLRGGLKTAPSAGACYPLEVYLVCGAVSGLEPGLYRYLPQIHRLQKERADDLRQPLALAALGQHWIETAPAIILFSAVAERTIRRYGERGRERYINMDLGHAAQNVYLQAETLGIGTCAVGAFNDTRLSEVLRLPAGETPLYLMPVGKRK